MKYNALIIRDIAHALGLSTARVLNALRGYDHVDPETRKRVLDYAREKHNLGDPTILTPKQKKARSSLGFVIQCICEFIAYLPMALS